MVKHSLLLLLILITGTLSGQQNVGIGTLTPGARLDIQSDAANSQLINVNSKVNYIGSIDIKAFEGTSITMDGYGIGGRFTGGFKGLDGIASGGTYIGAAYGIYGNATGTAGVRTGVFGTASGGASNYGLWGSVSGGANHFGVYGQNTNLTGYAGYFNGRGFFTHELRADRNLVVDDTTWTHRIMNQSGPLDIDAISDVEIMIDRTNGPSIGFFEIFNGTGSHLFFVNESGNSRSFGNHYVDNNLGVGTLTPASKLQILGGTDAGLLTNGYMQLGPAASWNLVLDDNEIMARSNGAGNDLLFQQDAGNILMCGLEQGKVGIGVQLASNLPAGYMLAVDGKIIGEEVRIQNSNNWPDYVFKEDYKLMPLDELKNSIAQHQHLPNIPSATVVEKDGILVGDMQKRMMEKIEELTLYILEIHETNKQQQAEIEKLKMELKLVPTNSQQP